MCPIWALSHAHSSRLDVASHSLRFLLDFLEPRFHQIADRYEAEEHAIFHHRQVTDAAPRHQRERSIDLLREKRAALITAAVTGKIDVRAAA